MKNCQLFTITFHFRFMRLLFQIYYRLMVSVKKEFVVVIGAAY